MGKKKTNEIVASVPLTADELEVLIYLAQMDGDPLKHFDDPMGAAVAERRWAPGSEGPVFSL